jgi:hypothetical protein
MTRILTATAALFGSIVLAGCGKADEPAAQLGRNAQAIIEWCVSDGTDRAICTCTATALETALDKENLVTLTDFATRLSKAQSGGEKEALFGQAIGNPELARALDKVAETEKQCQYLAAVEAVKVEVAAAEKAKKARQQSASRRTCPHTAATAPRAPGAPVADVAGVRPGMSFEDAEGVIECQGIYNFDVKERWARNNQGLPTRQLLRAADGDVCPAELRVKGGAGCEDGGYRFAPLKDVTQQFIVAFAGMPGAERAGVIWRRTVFPEGKHPTVSSLAEALTEKYGAPHMQATQENYYSLGHRRGTTVYSWVFDPSNRPIASGDSARRARCVNGPRPTLQNQMSWNSSCGLTVRAEIVPTAPGALLARELNVVVMDQRRFDEEVKRFEASIKAAVEAGQRDKGIKPTL